MSVVTIRGPYGSGAPEIGRRAAKSIHADYVDRRIIAEVAAKLKSQKQEVAAKEMPPGTILGRIVEALSRGYTMGVGYEGVYLPAWEIGLDDTRYLAGLEAVIKELARKQSLVIRGRGSQFILKDYPGALHVLVVAPLEVRIKRVMQRFKMDEETAKKEIARYDSSHHEFIKRYFNADLADPLNYDLVINTGHLSYEDSTSIIVDAVPLKERNVKLKS
jgi:cytidylate kinase